MQTTDRSKKFVIGFLAVLLAFLVLVTTVIVIHTSLHTSTGIQPDMVLLITSDNGGALAGTSQQPTEIKLDKPSQTESTDSPAWTTQTKINIFEHNDPHVQGDGTGSADHVIAPGTSNIYSFSLKNDKAQAVKYRLEVTGDNDTEMKIPVKVRLLDTAKDNSEVAYSDINGLWLKEDGSMGANAEHVYQIDWKWDFEGNSDEYDTLLGDTAVDRELSCHLNINVVAELDPAADTSKPASTPDEPGEPAKTGDASSALVIVLSAAVLASAAVVMAFFKKKKHSDS